MPAQFVRYELAKKAAAGAKILHFRDGKREKVTVTEKKLSFSYSYSYLLEKWYCYSYSYSSSIFCKLQI